MGSADIPPPHVPAFVVPATDAMLQVGGALWTACYIQLVRLSLRDETYGMPLLAQTCNISWEAVYAFLIAEEPLERGGAAES